MNFRKLNVLTINILIRKFTQNFNRGRENFKAVYFEIYVTLHVWNLKESIFASHEILFKKKCERIK